MEKVVIFRNKSVILPMTRCQWLSLLKIPIVHKVVVRPTPGQLYNRFLFFQWLRLSKFPISRKVTARHTPWQFLIQPPTTPLSITPIPRHCIRLLPKRRTVSLPCQRRRNQNSTECRHIHHDEHCDDQVALRLR